ncbi:MAG: polymer-forming cytoskeletal protein [Aquisalinus sp.]|nr:polymer-forming cytoskeletal protein [Aquisalinus sp.]
MFNANNEIKCDTILAPGSQLEGKLTCKGPSRISGHVEGDLVADDHLIIGEGAQINGNVLGSTTVEVRGTVTGAVRAADRVVLRPGSLVDGEVECPSIVIDEGARFNGTTKMSKPDMGTLSAPDLKVVSGESATE